MTYHYKPGLEKVTPTFINVHGVQQFQPFYLLKPMLQKPKMKNNSMKHYYLTIPTRFPPLLPPSSYTPFTLFPVPPPPLPPDHFLGHPDPNQSEQD